MTSFRVLRLSATNVEQLLSSYAKNIKTCQKSTFSCSTSFRFNLPNEQSCSILPPQKPLYLTPSRSSASVSLPPSAYDLSRSAYVPGKSKVEDSITVRNENGLCIIVLPLYSRNEVCRFVIKPLMHTLNDFIMHVKAEDPGIEKIKVYTIDGQLICNSTSCSNLLRADFILQLNGLNYLIHLNDLDFSAPYLSDDSQRSLVAQLYMALHSSEIYVKRQEKLLQRLEEVQYELEPFEKSLQDIKELAHRKAKMSAWVGLSMMGLQFGVLARLTWWEYSWDIMEPVTYFVTYGTLIAFYAYYVITNKEYMYPTVYSRQVLSQIYKIGERGGFDLVRYNQLCDEADRIKYDLRRLQDPLRLQLHPHHLEKGTTPLL